MRAIRIAAVLTVALSVLTGAAGAHPLGNATISHYSGLVIGPDAIEIDYVLDLAEIPTFQERDVNDIAAQDRCTELATGLQVSLDGQELDPAVGAAEVEFLPGPEGLDTTRIECRLRAEFDRSDKKRELAFEDGNYGSHQGWRELTVRGSEVRVESSLPVETISDRLATYPEDALRPDVRRVEVTFVADAGIPTDSTFGQPNEVTADRADSSNGTTLPLLVALGVLATLLGVAALRRWHVRPSGAGVS